MIVYFDGDCPVCRTEVDLYRRMDGCGKLDWQDLASLDDAELPEGKTREQLLRIFHARGPSGEWQTGVDAFGAIWTQLPVFHRFAWLFRYPVSRQLAHVFYWLFLAWQRLDRRWRQMGVAN